MSPRLLVLIGVAVILVAVFAVTRTNGDGGVRAIAPPGIEAGSARVQSPPIAHEDGPFLPPLSAFPAIANRPLFRPDRRPVAVEVIQTPVQQTLTRDGTDQPPELIVVSIVTGPDTGSIATIRVNGETRRVHAGDQVGNWRIDAIRLDGVEVSSGRERWALPVGEAED